MDNEQRRLYTGFVEEWRPKITTMVRSFGFGPQDVEDITSDIIVEFMSRDNLSVYDPELGAMSSFVYGFCKYQLLWAWSKNKRRAQRTAYLEEIPMWREPSFDDENYSLVDLNEQLEGIAEELGKLEVHGTRDLLRLFTDLVDQVRESGRASQKELAERYHVSTSAVCLAVGDLRRNEAVRGLLPIDRQDL